MNTKLQQLLDLHSAVLKQNPCCYFELAYTRQTQWMAWLCSKPQEDDPHRKVLAKGQGQTPEQAAEAALISFGGILRHETPDPRPSTPGNTPGEDMGPLAETVIREYIGAHIASGPAARTLRHIAAGTGTLLESSPPARFIRVEEADRKRLLPLEGLEEIQCGAGKRHISLHYEHGGLDVAFSTPEAADAAFESIARELALNPRP